jgi:ribosomal protein S25
MGSKKKQTKKKQKKPSKKKTEDKKRKSEEKSMTRSKDQKTLSIVAPDMKGAVLKEIEKMKVLTPYSVGSKFDIRLSVAKKFLDDLYKKGLITHIGGGRNIKLYKPVRRND